jgi:hypothetical protein
MRVRVHYHLIKKCLSVAYKGKVVAYTPEIQLTNVKFIVHPSGLRRTRQTKRRNVHAWVEGDIDFSSEVDTDKRIPVNYNPFKRNCFYEFFSKKKIKKAQKAWILGKNILVKI